TFASQSKAIALQSKAIDFDCNAKATQI
ncbi:MAG: hypothetical protein RIS64_3683, partial [Bacteroidota bacterium]